MVPDSAPPEIETPDTVDLLIRHNRWRGFWRALFWGGGAAAAVTAVVLVSQTPIGAERLHLAFEQAREPNRPQAVAPMPPRVVVDEAATKRLADAVRTLTADRDRLNARIANLERNFNDMTGSIKTVLQANAAVQSVKEPPKEPAQEKTAALAPPPPTMSAPPDVAPPSAPVAANVLEPASPSPPQTSEQLPRENVPLPPVRVASAPAAEPSAELPAKPEYGADLGAAVSVEAIRGEWAKVKANYGPLLAGLRPVASPRRHDYRLVVGPFPTAAAAAKLCAKFNAARVACHTAKFTGEAVAQR